MKLFKDFLLKLYEKVVLNKILIIKLLAALGILVLASFLIEYYGFGYKLHALEKTNAGIFEVGKADLLTDDNSLTIATNGRYVQNLELSLGENPDYDIIVQYVDTNTGQDVVLQERLEKSMQKNEFNFVRLLVFNIENNPEKITISATNAQSSISKISIDNSYHFNFYHFFFFFSLGLLLFIFTICRKKVGKNPEYVFFAIALICGTLIAVSELHSYVSWDEAIHYRIADGNSFGSVIKNGVKDVYSKTNSVPSSYSITEQENIDKYFDSQVAKENKGKGFSVFNFSLRDTYSQLGHIPSGMALLLGRLFRLPNHLVFIFGRWINALVYAVVIFFAIRKLKTGKMILSVVALFPTAIFAASNYGYDYWVTAFTMLGFAYLFSELQQPEKKITSKNLSIIIGSFVVGLGPKAIYFPIMFLLFLLKKEKFKSLGQYKKFIWVAIISILFVVGSFMLPFMITGQGGGDHRGGSEVNSAMQVKFILSSPVAYSKILLNFMSGYLNPENAGGFINFFAYLGSIKGLLLVELALLVVVVTDKNKYDKLTSDWKIKSWMIVIFLVTVVLISTALYVAFTAVGNAIISGVQPRYLLPLIFPLLFVIGSSRVKNPFNRNIYNLVIFAVMAYVLLLGIWDAIIKMHY